MSGDVSRSYPGPDDRDTKARTSAFLDKLSADVAAMGLCRAHWLPRDTCPHCAPPGKDPAP